MYRKRAPSVNVELHKWHPRTIKHSVREPPAVQGDLFWISHLEAAAHTGECAISALAQRYVPSAMVIAGAGGRLGVALLHWGLVLVVEWLSARGEVKVRKVQSKSAIELKSLLSRPSRQSCSSASLLECS